MLDKKPPKTDHLKAHQFKPGKSGNPGGKPPGPNASTLLVSALPKDQWAAKIATLCKQGSTHALKIYAEYVFGKPQENVSLSGGISMYEQGAAQTYDKNLLLAAMKRLSGGK